MKVPSAEKVKVVKQLTRPEILFAMTRRPGSGLIYFGGSDFKVHAVDLDQDKPQVKYLGGHDSYVTGLALAGPYLVSGSYDGRLIWWEAGSGSRVRAVDAHRKWIRQVAASPDGKIVASVADDMVCRLWEAATGRMLLELRGHEEMTPHHFSSMLFACVFSPDGRHIATGDKVGHINVWATDSGDRVAAIEAPTFYTWDPVQRRHSIGGVRALAFSPDGAKLAVGGIGQIGNIDHLDSKPRVEVYDWRKGERMGEAQGEGRGLVERLEFHPKGDWLLGAGGYSDGFLLFCDPAGKKALAQAKAPMYIHDFALNEARDRVYSVGHHKIALFQLSE